MIASSNGKKLTYRYIIIHYDVTESILAARALARIDLTRVNFNPAAR